MAEEAIKRYGSGKTKIALAGGVFANVKLNQRIKELGCVKEIFVHPHMGDGGLSIGAAYLLWSSMGNKRVRPKTMPNIYLGPDYSDEEIKTALGKHGLKYNHKDSGMEKCVAQLIHSGKVVARFSGRMEYGPRSLGNRSILYHARDASVNDWLNKRLKRTEFMPFAPSSIIERSKDLFLNGEKALETGKFMTISLDSTSKMKMMSPSVPISIKVIG